MKLLHTSDWHLGMMAKGGLSYAEDQTYVIDQIINIAKTEKVDGIIIAGDVFDKSVASQEALRLYDDIITNMCFSLNIPIFIVAGNHDGAGRLSQCNRLLQKSGLYIAGSLLSEPQKFNFGDVDVFLLPWISTDKVRTIYPDSADEITSLESAYKVVLDKYRETFTEGHKNVLVAHAYVTGGETSTSDTSAVVGTAARVDKSVFEGFDYVALGHLHGPQDISDTIRYSGTPMAYSFGTEEKQNKSVTIYDSVTSEHKVIELTPLRKRTTIKDTLENILKCGYDQDVVDGYVRLEVTDTYVGYETAASFVERYKNFLEYSCPSIASEKEGITLTIDDLNEVKKDPYAVFEAYCKDVLNIEPSDSFIELFNSALNETAKEEE